MTYQDARIGDTALGAPLILGHEFASVVEAAGADALGGDFEPVRVREHAQKRGLSIGKFSRAADINLSTARRLWYSTADGVEHSKKGSLERVDFEVLEKLCRFFSLPPGEFFDLVDDTPDRKDQ